MRFLLIILLLAIASSAKSQEYNGNHGEGHDQWHGDFYQGLVTPTTKVSCCNLADCRPTEGREAGGHYEVMIDKKWVRVLSDKIVKKSAPDGGFHVCAPLNFSGKPEHVYCVILAPEG